jgi:hypothetical protein
MIQKYQLFYGGKAKIKGMIMDGWMINCVFWVVCQIFLLQNQLLCMHGCKATIRDIELYFLQIFEKKNWKMAVFWAKL